MKLLLFYIHQIFNKSHLPLPSDICSGEDVIEAQCTAALSFNFIIFGIALAAVIFSLVRKRYRAQTIFMAPVLIISSFIFTDRAVKSITSASMYGIEWFVISYYLWAFIIFNVMLLTVLFHEKRKKLLIFSAILTFILTLFFAYSGRGNFEQVTILLGGIYGKVNLEMIWLAFSVKLVVILAASVIISSIVFSIGYWIKTGDFRPVHLYRSVPAYLLILPMIGFTLLSIPLGEIFERRDVKEAKAYIEEIKKKVDKYYFENGEYPKFIEEMIPEGRSPKLLERHEYFTAGLKGTYFFSREDKYCFLFQNPTKDFGYYSITSEREWRYAKDTQSYESVFVNLCDESMKNSEDLIAGHLGIDAKDQVVNQMAVESNEIYTPAQSRAASRILEEKIMEEGKRDPELIRMYTPLPENEEKKKGK